MYLGAVSIENNEDNEQFITVQAIWQHTANEPKMLT